MVQVRREGGHRAEGIDEGRVRDRAWPACRRLRCFPTADGGAIKAEAFGKDVLGQFADRHAEMLPGAKGVHKFDVHHLGPAFLGQFNYTLGCAHLLRSFIMSG